MDLATALWIIGILVAAIGALARAIYNSNSREIQKLREWRHHEADPAIRLTGWLKERIEKLERDDDKK